MPELPEAEKARRALERLCVGRRIARVEDGDAYVCRPHLPGEIDLTLRGQEVIAACRHGKFLWLETDGGHELGLHLGMGGSIRAAATPAPRGWDRVALVFDDGSRVALRDKRRLSRAHLGAGIDHLGPDAHAADRRTFVARIGRGGAPIKARLLDQSALAGVGNLLADEALWAARIDPRRPAGELDPAELAELHRALRAAIRSALGERGGSGRGPFARARRSGSCPRCEGPLARDRIGGRTTYWCADEQGAATPAR
jgi:formamidopyrimidine-DNA glycosylase